MAMPTKKIPHEQFEALLDACIEKIILNDRITLDEFAILTAAQDYPDHNHMKEIPVKSKMYYCKAEARVLDKLKAGLARYGINSLSDVMETSRGRSYATVMGKATDSPE